MSCITALLTFALLHLSVQAANSTSSIKLGCLSAAPDTANAVVLAPGTASLTACTDLCTASSSPYAYFANATSSCWCGASPAESTSYVDGVDHDANCGESAVWYTAIISSSNSTINTTTTCPFLGPPSSAQLPGYTYLSSLPDPLSCYSACEAAGLNVTLLQPGLGGYSCACAEDIEGESYTEVCNSQSWYAVEHKGI